MQSYDSELGPAVAQWNWQLWSQFAQGKEWKWRVDEMSWMDNSTAQRIHCSLPYWGQAVKLSEQECARIAQDS